MFSRLIQISLRHASVVLMLAGLVLAFAIWRIPQMTVDVFPELNAPTVVVITEAAGLSADEVEQYVTFPVETAVNGVPGVRRIRSGSANSLSIVYIEFDWGADIRFARNFVAERLAMVKERLPESVHTEIAPITGVTGEIMMLGISSPDNSVSELELRSYAEFELTNRLLAVPGVAQVVSIGGQMPEYQVNIRQEQLLLYGLTADEVSDAARKAHSVASAGYLANVEGQELPVRQTAQVRSVDDIKNTIIRYHNGAAVTIAQVADVTLGAAPRRGTASEGGRSAVVLGIGKSPGTNTLKITADIDAVLDQIEPSLPKGMQLNRHVMRQANFIHISLDNVLHVLRDAAIFVTVILVLFLLNVRTTVITLTALPLSLGVTLLLMDLLGMTVNVMTLGGLAVAIGILVDDAIIDVENVFRRLRENAALPVEMRRPVAEVVFQASNEIRSAMVFATVLIVIVFVPLLFLQGMEGRFFRPLGITYITSILASLVVALTVTPAMCKYLLRGRLGRHAERDGFLVRFLKSVYSPLLRLAVRGRMLVAVLALALIAASLLLARTFGTAFLPAFNEGTVTVFLAAPPGTSLEESDRLARNVEMQLLKLEGVQGVVRRTGRAERDAHAEPPSNSEIELALKPGVRREDLAPAIDAIAAQVAGVSCSTGQPIEHRLSLILSGTPAAIAVNVYGQDLPTLRQIAREVEEELKRIPGTREVTGNREAMMVSLPIRYRHEDLKRFGLAPADAAHQVQDAFNGEVVAEVNEGVRRYDIVVRLAADERRNVEDVRNLILRGGGGTLLRLHEVADVGRELTSMAIQRENSRRKAVISANLAEGHNLGHVIQAVRKRIDPIVRRYGYAVHYGGQFEAQQSASRTITYMGGGVILLMLLMLQAVFGTFRSAMLVMLNLPLALVGGIAAIYLTESGNLWQNTLALLGLGAGRYEAPVISIASLVGFITLFGIAVRNGILLVDRYNVLLKEGKGLHEAIYLGSMERLTSILMTALAAALGLVPLAMSGGQPGSELLSPLAIVVLGGLATSTLLNLLVVPAGFALLFGRRDEVVAAGAPGPDAEPQAPERREE